MLSVFSRNRCPLCSGIGVRFQQEYAEGAIVVVFDDNSADIFCHAWNKYENEYFDVTNEIIWKSDETLNKPKRIDYIVVKGCLFSEITGPELNFSEEVISFVSDGKKKLDSQKRKE